MHRLRASPEIEPVDRVMRSRPAGSFFPALAVIFQVPDICWDLSFDLSFSLAGERKGRICPLRRGPACGIGSDCQPGYSWIPHRVRYVREGYPGFLVGGRGKNWGKVVVLRWDARGVHSFYPGRYSRVPAPGRHDGLYSPGLFSRGGG